MNSVNVLIRCLSVVLTAKGRPVQEQQLMRAYDTGQAIDVDTLIRISGELGLKAGCMQVDKSHLAMLPYPLLAIMEEEQHKYMVVLGCSQGQVIFYNPWQNSREAMSLEEFQGRWTGHCVLFALEEAKTAEAGTGLGWFRKIILKYKGQLLKVMFLSLLLQLFGLCSPLFTQVIIDNVLVHHSVSTLDVMVGGMALVMIFQLIIGGFRSYIFTHGANRADAELSSKLFKRMMYLPSSFYSHMSAGDIVARVRELEKIRQFITGTGVTLVLDGIFAIIYLVVMFHYSIQLGLIVLVGVPLYTFLNLAIVPIYRRRLNENFHANADSQAYIIETVTGVETVKQHGVESRMEQRWQELLGRTTGSARGIANLANLAGSVGNMYQQIFMLAILWYGAYLVMAEELTLGRLIAFQMFAGMLIGPVMRIFSLWQNFQQAKVSWDKLGDILNSPVEPAFNPNRTVMPRLRGELRLENVSFGYGGQGQQVLRQLNMDFPAGRCIGIVGPSGSGKSTITRLLQLLYKPDNGRVLVDGMDMKQMEPAWLRRQLGVVLQESFLFNGTIAENIAMAKPGASLQEIHQAAELAGVMEFAREMPKGLDTLVGERGGSLSGGQRQRVAIARAIINRPPVLILDEATSALDLASERIIMDSIAKLKKGRTVIMIAHRLSTVMACDNIYVVSQGNVAEKGSHSQLMEQRGIYYSLWMEQQNTAVVS